MATALHEYDDDHLKCRRGNLGHTWAAVGYFAEGGTVKRRLGCERCGTERIDTWSVKGERVRARYSYADLYLVQGGVEALDVRREVLKRVVIYDNEATMLAAFFGAT